MVRSFVTFISFTTTLVLLAGCGNRAKTPAAQPTPSTAGLIEIARTFVDRMAKGDFTAATGSFDDTMKIAAPAESLKTIWGELIASVGAFQQQTEAYADTFQGNQAVYVACQFEKNSLDIRVVFNGQGQISGFQFVAAGTTPTPVGTP